MTKHPISPLVGLLALAVLAGTVSAQVPKKPDVVGTWTGFALTGDGSRLDITVVLGKAQNGYTGKLSDASGLILETPLKDIVFKDNKLALALDLVLGPETMPIKIELTLENETLKGLWFDPEGNSGEIELSLEK
jgi:hypothetical protein